MKGQSVNIDWVVGMGLFMLTLISGILLVYNSEPSSSLDENRQKASLVQQELEDEARIKGRQSPLYVRGPVNTTRIPVDSDYVFSSKAYPGSGAMDIPANVNISSGDVVTVVDGGNYTYDLSYFYSNRTNLSYSGDIDTGGGWMNSTDIQLKPSSPGLEAMRVNDRELLNETAELSGNVGTPVKRELYAHALEEDLKVYNGSKEFILEDAGEVTFHLKNLSTLYWYSDNSTTDLVGTDTSIKNGDTEGFTVASDYGVTFTGNITDANVSKPSGAEVKAVIDAGRLRVFLHNSGYETGRKRIIFSDKGDIFFGAEEIIKGAAKNEIEKLKSETGRTFRSRLKIRDFEYNISYGSLSRGGDIPFENVVVSDRPGVMLGRYGNFSRIESRVAIWR